MPLLQMDVDAVLGVCTRLGSTHDSLANNASALNSLVTAMVGKTWVAPGANQFQADFQNWLVHFNALLQALEQDKNRLQQEVTRWEEVARSY